MKVDELGSDLNKGRENTFVFVIFGGKDSIKV